MVHLFNIKLLTLFTLILTLLGILQVIQPVSASEYVQWTDSKEGAFTTQFPSDWQNVICRLERISGIPTPIIRAVSPDGLIDISFGDDQVPAMYSPPPRNAPLAVQQQQSIFTGILCQMPANVYAQLYVTNFLPVEYGYTDMHILNSSERSEISEELNKVNPVGAYTEYDVGDVSFTCLKNGNQVNGYYCIIIQNVQFGWVRDEYNPWRVVTIRGYVTPASEADTARSVTTHMISTYRIDPEWYAREVGAAVNSVGVTEKIRKDIDASNVISEVFSNINKVQDDTSHDRENFILGQTDVIDQNTGTAYQVDAGHNYYWLLRGTNQYVTTEADESPGLGFVPLTEQATES